jgi:hypothetical protein
VSLLEDTPVRVAPTSTGTTPRGFLRRHRVALGLAVLLLGALVLLALTTGVGRSGTLDPESYEPSGARALATLLEQQGVDVQRTTDIATTLAGTDSDTTIFVPQPRLLTDTEVGELGASSARLVLVAPGPLELSKLGSGIELTDAFDQDDVEPGCTLDLAVRAGTARLEGYAYEAQGATSCYDGLLLDDSANHSTVVLGDPKALSNDRLAKQGNAALGLGLLGATRTVHWFVPAPDRAGADEVRARSLNDLLPDWVKVGALQLLVATAVLGLWRSRRLGRVVAEPLPIVVRAAETVEGRGRLYRAAGSRGTAAEALRSGARDRLGQRLGAGRHPEPEVLAELVAARTSRPATQVQDLLYGPPPVDDAALVRLATDLDDLIQEVAGS